MTRTARFRGARELPPRLIVVFGMSVLFFPMLARAASPQMTASVAAQPATAQQETAAILSGDADSLLRIAIPTTLQNRRTAMAFTYGINYRNRNFTPRGRLLTDYNAKYEVIFLEGLPYRRQIEENQKPLNSAEAASERQRYDQALALRSHMTLDQKRDYLKRPWNVDVPLQQLTSLFTNRVTGDETLDGRPTTIIESEPRVDAHPEDEEQRRALHKRVKLWIDHTDLIVSRIEVTLIADDASMKRGTVACIEFFKKDGVWLPSRSDVKFEAMVNGENEIPSTSRSAAELGIVRGETEEVNSDFHRFRVDVRLIDSGEKVAGRIQTQ